MLKRWHVVVAVSSFVAMLLWVAIPYAWAATDAYFAGRALRMTRVAVADSKCLGEAQSCIQFDTANRFRFWNGTTLTQVVITPSPSPSPGAILVGNGTNWNQLQPGSNGQVLKIVTGVPAWAAP